MSGIGDCICFDSSCSHEAGAPSGFGHGYTFTLFPFEMLTDYTGASRRLTRVLPEKPTKAGEALGREFRPIEVLRMLQATCQH